ncbi:TetR/AcrR family transcriptional regulator [Glycomyces sp. TRM65418]|uniref:TetR/AcrR family transcriptional regulator n=1 Tax=Glycomyces sp. TRM65418 TaxID=2867006 RepID=UPI001CE50A7A|nr:TetR/AcrR family transcriptional regulator [Glycomyces sp. TRM65418]MCC3764429.1 TetR/AcrR family transcriptional regulator [Glycomyces sp. TRM65418]QZD54104.1 TetR/AcrR family transcriptional regulator [Glycomyces sp. TRM65418]
MPTTAKRTERIDAQRNRRKVLETADRLFGERGTAVSLGEIATEAGVGAGTVYRHFPTKDALLATVLDQRLLLLGDTGAAMLRREDPENAFFEYLEFLTGQSLANRAICEALAARGDWQEPSKLDGHCVVDAPLAELLRRAQRAGAVRSDLDFQDVRAVLSGCVGMALAAASPERAGRLTRAFWDVLRVERNPEDRNETRVATETSNEISVTERSCPVCGGPIALTATGRPATYCSSACRQKAFRDKRKAA